MYERHISVEDNIIFPLAARSLNESDKRAIADEMAGRRQVKLVPLSV
jgi:hemerythrin-like domain-containing protein